tara:strand:- start:1792 stop:2187 length:396 start_codon:yes stop_codon:yes gene_type:complete
MANEDKDFVEGCDTITINGETVFSVNPEPDYKISYSTPTIDVSSISTTSSSTIDSSHLTVNTSTIGTHTFDDNYTFTTTYETPTVFEDVMPDLVTVNDMMVEYPTLKIAFEKFKRVYKMVEQDYKGKTENE